MHGTWRSSGRCHVFGDNIPHDNAMIAFNHIAERQTNPDVLIPDLFASIDPGFVSRVQRGDFVIAGQNFGSGKGHTTAYIAMEALGLRVICESTFERVIRGAANLALPIMTGCSGISKSFKTGDEIDVDMSTGVVIRLSSGERFSYPPIPEGLRSLLEDGGRKGFLKKWLVAHPELEHALKQPA